MSKKIFAIVLGIILVLSFAACGGNNEATTNAPTDADETTVANADETTTASAEETSASDETTVEESSEEATSDEVISEETTVEVKNATLSVEQADDISGIGAGKVFNASTDEYAFYAVFRTDVDIKDVKVLGLTFVDAADDGTITFEKEELYTQTELISEEILCVYLTADGSIPAFGISYTDTDGTVKSFSVNMSGEDGSLYLTAIK